MKKKAGYIDGIYNYCDRWCERCVFTSRCRNFEGIRKLNPEEQDIENKAFWDKIAKNFETAIKLLHKAAEKSGIDLNAVSAEEKNEYSRKAKRDRNAAKSQPLAKVTLLYIEKGRKLLENEELMKEKANDMVRHFELGIQSEDQVSGEVSVIKDCQEIITWYLHFIHVKFMRALMGKLEDDGWEEANGFQRDCDGSAKIAMIAIDKSIEAWTLMLQFIPAAEDEIIELLALLQKSRRMAESEFPKARAFVRPGFDEQ
jgi:hypothetical protein